MACSSVLSLAQAELQTDKAIINDATQRISAFANFTTPVHGDLYLATQINNTLLFFSGNGDVSAEIIPFSQEKEYSGRLPLFDFSAKGITAGRYPLYQVVTHPGTDPMPVS